jgi:hypothetical protein
VTEYRRRLLELATEHGRTVERTKGSHFRLVKAGEPPVFASYSPSDPRALKNLAAELKRMDRNKP